MNSVINVQLGNIRNGREDNGAKLTTAKLIFYESHSTVMGYRYVDGVFKIAAKAKSV
jgi:hypothetical protein